MKTFFEHAHTSVAGGSQVAGYLLGALQEVYLCPLAMACSQVAAGSQVVATSACHVSMHCCCTQHLVTISKFPTLSALLFLFAARPPRPFFVCSFVAENRWHLVRGCRRCPGEGVSDCRQLKHIWLEDLQRVHAGMASAYARLFPYGAGVSMT